MTEGEVMAEKFDRDLELVKIQIAAEDIQSGYVTMLAIVLGGMLSVTVLVVSAMRELLLSSFLFWVLLCLFVGFAALGLFMMMTHPGDFKKVDGFIEDFRNQRRLPPLAKMCAVRKYRRDKEGHP